tara:strand:+ start:103425 stop:103916 length:492 start_codon:yes stop_codon:yes gene_type:complete
MRQENQARAICLFLAAFFALCMVLPTTNHAMAQKKSRIPPMTTYHAMLDGNLEGGWIGFRNFDGRQLVYFSALQTLHCRLKEIRYSVNSTELDRQFPLVACNPQNPFALPPDSGVNDILVRLDAGAASTVAVQVVWEDGSKSRMAVYEPCEDVGDQTCAWLLE